MMVLLFYSDISNFTYFEVLTFLNVKIFLIGFLDELGNFKQIFLHFKMHFFTFYSNGPDENNLFLDEGHKKTKFMTKLCRYLSFNTEILRRIVDLWCFFSGVR